MPSMPEEISRMSNESSDNIINTWSKPEDLMTFVKKEEVHNHATPQSFKIIVYVFFIISLLK